LLRELGECHAIVLELRDRAYALGESIDTLSARAAWAADLRAERDPLDPKLEREKLPKRADWSDVVIDEGDEAP